MKPELSERLFRLEAIEEIKQLKHVYCLLVDRGLAGDMTAMDELAGKFAEDAEIDYGDFGSFKGKEQIAAFFKSVVAATFSFGSHMVFNPVISVQDNAAKGKWYVHAAGTLKTSHGGVATWTQAKYEDEYEKVDGEWKFKSITVAFDFLTPFDKGWARTKMVRPE